MGVKNIVIKCMGPLYPLLFKTRIKNRKLEKEIQNLTFQVNYLKHHSDIRQLKPATGVLREFQLAEIEYARYILGLLKPYDIEMYLDGDYNKLIQVLKTDPNFVWIDSSQKTGYFSEYFDKLIRANANKNIGVMTPHCLHIFNGTCLRDAKNVEFFPNDFLKEDVTEEQYLAFRDKVIAFIREPHSWKEIFDFYETNWKESGIYSLEPTSRIVPGLGSWDLTQYGYRFFCTA